MNKIFINYNNKTFIIKDNTNNGEVDKVHIIV